MNAKCTNQNCPERDVVKLAEGIPLDVVILCGDCGRECQRTSEPWIDPNPQEVTDDNPTN